MELINVQRPKNRPLIKLKNIKKNSSINYNSKFVIKLNIIMDIFRKLMDAI